MILNNAEGVYLGNNEVKKIYKGETLIWQKQQNQNTSIPADYILALDFNGDFVDKSGNFTFESSSFPSFVAGRKANTHAVDFRDNKFIKSVENVVYANQAITLSLWLKSTQMNGFFISHPSSYSYGGYYCRLSASKIKYVTILPYYAYNNVESSNSLNDNTWHNIVVTSKQGELNLWIDGVKDSSISQKYPSQINQTKLVIGSFTLTGQDYYVGQLQDLRIYNRVLSDAEIQSLYNE